MTWHERNRFDGSGYGFSCPWRSLHPSMNCSRTFPGQEFRFPGWNICPRRWRYTWPRCLWWKQWQLLWCPRSAGSDIPSWSPRRCSGSSEYHILYNIPGLGRSWSWCNFSGCNRLAWSPCRIVGECNLPVPWFPRFYPCISKWMWLVVHLGKEPRFGKCLSE